MKKKLLNCITGSMIVFFFLAQAGTKEKIHTKTHIISSNIILIREIKENLNNLNNNNVELSEYINSQTLSTNLDSILSAIHYIPSPMTDLYETFLQELTGLITQIRRAEIRTRIIRDTPSETFQECLRLLSVEDGETIEILTLEAVCFLDLESIDPNETMPQGSYSFIEYAALGTPLNTLDQIYSYAGRPRGATILANLISNRHRDPVDTLHSLATEMLDDSVFNYADIGENNLISLAVMHNNVIIFDLLISYFQQQGHDGDIESAVNLSNRMRQTPLMNAIRDDHLKLVRLLIEYGANVEHCLEGRSRTIIEWAIIFHPEGHPIRNYFLNEFNRTTLSIDVQQRIERWLERERECRRGNIGNTQSQ